MIIFIILLYVFVMFCSLYYLFPLIRVVGTSMYPTYCEEEVILGSRIFRKSNLKVGDVIVYRSPVDNDRLVIKRIDHFLRDGRKLYIYCLGDNAGDSYDSRHYGFVSSKNIVCKVLDQRRNRNHGCNNNLCD